RLRCRLPVHSSCSPTDTPAAEIYPLSLHDALPICGRGYGEAHAKAIHGGWGGADYADLMAWTDFVAQQPYIDRERMGDKVSPGQDRKSTRLNSSHVKISYAVFCLKKKKHNTRSLPR